MYVDEQQLETCRHRLREIIEQICEHGDEIRMAVEALDALDAPPRRRLNLDREGL